jgi:pseudaminic acid synthase|tara:strand:+ start:577 stop:1617 length:1041 start_codon:yes stop_codon:yes gene_type:complete
MIKITKNFFFSYNSKPKIIAEISGNHGGKKTRFLSLIKHAFKNGADLVKIQTYEPIDITLKKKTKNYKIKSGIWKGMYLWDLYQKACTPFSWHKEAFDLAKKYKKIIFSSPFSIRAVDLLENLNVKLYKIASFEITDLKLINYIASKKKPIIISTGMASKKEVDMAIKEIKKFHNKIIILHCVSSYPTKLQNTNLFKINDLKKYYNNKMIGISDHTDNIYSSIASIPMGVVAIEKHFKLNDSLKTADSSFSITPEMLKNLSNINKEINLSLKKKKDHNHLEENSKKLRRSIFAKKNIRKNEALSEDNIVSLRPFVGICSSQYFKIIGKKSKKNFLAGEPILKKNII